MSHQPEIHVGDRGTRYELPLEDQDGPFDPSDASVKQIVFRTPDGVIVKDAEVVAYGSPATSWGLGYTIEEGDGLGSPTGEFHNRSGKLRVQAYLEWLDGRRFHSTERFTDDAGRELRIAGNIRTMTDANEFED